MRKSLKIGAGERTRTFDLLITNQFEFPLFSACYINIAKYTAYFRRINNQIVKAAFGIILGALCTTANADYFAELLSVHYNKPPCKLWHQECGGYHTDWNMTDPGFRLGFDKSFGDASVRLSAFNLGKYSITADVWGAGIAEETIDAIGDKTAENYRPTRLFYSSGSMRGLAFTGTYTWNGWTVEVGPTYIQQDFEVKWWKFDGTLVHEVPKETLYGLGYMGSISKSFKNFYISGQLYLSTIDSKFGNCKFPSGVDRAYTFALGLKF